MFCLREVRSYWSTPHISDQEIEELARRNLIERRASGICALRLTEEGARVKNGPALKAPRNNGSRFSPSHDERTARLSQ